MPRAAVVYRKDQPMKIEEISLRPVGEHEVLVQIAACGVCHSDLSALNEFFACPTPVILGHEAAGIVQSVGSAVSAFAPGDAVLAAWSPACGHCRFCKRGRPQLCNLADDPGSRANDRVSAGGQTVTQFLGVGGFCEQTILADNALVKIDPTMPLDRAALLGCAVITGYGAVRYAAQVRAGDEVGVFGCGGIGLNIIQGARLQGASLIVAIDLDDTKLEMARRIGATHTLRGDAPDLHKTLRGMTRERAGLDFAFDAVGSVEIARVGFLAIAKGGEVILVGLAHQKDKLSISQIAAVTQEKVVRGTTNGSTDTWKTVPELIRLYQDHKLMLDELVSRTYALDDVNQAMDDLRSGRNARGVVVMG
ncbi:MAG: Zn-dependent alcohol dehydrogenase [Deltaproteobacteria bacterium]|nr:Zn-dependent alcohol dehydrogenase [Deltaproteobacteria bacterium]